ncbi:MAG: hypothetical protein V7765_08635 [Oleispira sp.]
MINTNITQAVINPNRNQRPGLPAIPERPSIPEKPSQPSGSNDQVRQAAVAIVENKQQKQLAETYLKAAAAQNTNASEDSGQPSFEDLQALARLSKSHQVIQVIDNNDGEKLKSVAAQRQEKIENFFRDMQSDNEEKVGGKLNQRA